MEETFWLSVIDDDTGNRLGMWEVECLPAEGDYVTLQGKEGQVTMRVFDLSEIRMRKACTIHVAFFET